ncbi:MAG: hypothetical protein IPK33_14095 [Gemmatimonadetes bacterium]|nr:hypothetical protein [Gemmatimonadota bacterium]
MTRGVRGRAGRWLQLAATTALLAPVGRALAQGGAHSGPQKARSVFAVPEVPAASLLDDASLQITRPGTMQDLASALINGIDRTGHVRQGLALEIAPLLLWGNGVNLERYRSQGGFMRANLRLSLATQRTAGDTGSTDISIGVRTTLIDERDYMKSKSLTDSLGRFLRACAIKFGPRGPGTVDTAAVNGCIREDTSPSSRHGNRRAGTRRRSPSPPRSAFAWSSRC